jgi:DNA-binding MarR family transcriptional regulator
MTEIMKRNLKRLRPESGPAEPWLQNWYAVRPDIDPNGIALIGRLFRLPRAWEKYRSGALRTLGVTPEVSDLTTSLLRSGEPYELSATELSNEATLTSGAMTYRIDRAEALGLVERRRSTSDRRGVNVRLTPAGIASANRNVDLHMELGAKLVGAFEAEDARELLRLLKALLAELHRGEELPRRRST